MSDPNDPQYKPGRSDVDPDIDLDLDDNDQPRPTSSSSGAMLYSVGDHVLPYSTVPCCFQDFNHLAQSSSIVVSLCCVFLPSFLLS